MSVCARAWGAAAESSAAAASERIAKCMEKPHANVEIVAIISGTIPRRSDIP
jgi:hypothetical protein